jgi:dTDP-4-amino-4,6-dideoxygalactose transaminase
VPGTEGKAFEREFAAFHDAQFGIACANGTAALQTALRALNIGHGDEVILPAYTFVATASAVLSVGAVPVFADVEADTLAMDAASAEAAITPRTAALLPVHVAGRPADLDAILAAATRHGLPVIEDAAQAHAASWRGKGVGAHGDAGAFSFQASKNLNSGEGGIVLTNREDLAGAAWSAVNIGRLSNGVDHDPPVVGTNFRMTEFQAAILRAQMRRLPEQTARRTASANALRAGLSAIPGIRLPFDDPRITCNAYHLFPFRYDNQAFGGRPLASFLSALRAEGVPCSAGYVPLYRESLFANLVAARDRANLSPRHSDYAHLELPVCEQAATDTIWLGQSLLLSAPAEMDDIVEAVGRIQAAWTN